MTSWAVIVSLTDQPTTRHRSVIADQLLNAYVAHRTRESGRRFVGVPTDGAESLCFNLTGDALVQVSSLEINGSAGSAAKLVFWLEDVLSTVTGISYYCKALLAVSLAVLRNLRVFFEAQNPTDEPTRQYQGGIRRWVIQNERYGRTSRRRRNARPRRDDRHADGWAGVRLVRREVADDVVDRPRREHAGRECCAGGPRLAIADDWRASIG